MSNRRSALLKVPVNRAEGMADGTITTFLSRRSMVKIGIPVFVFPNGGGESRLYIRLGTRRVIKRGDECARTNTGLSQKELDAIFSRKTVYGYDILEANVLEHPVSRADFDVESELQFIYSEVTLEEVLS